jgi:hypothetical protein
VYLRRSWPFLSLRLLAARGVTGCSAAASHGRESMLAAFGQIAPPRKPVTPETQTAP